MRVATDADLIGDDGGVLGVGLALAAIALWYVVGLLASLVLLLVVALAPGRIVDLFAGADAPPLAAETARPIQIPPAGAAQRPTVEEPFRGSPVASWASGAEGITVPKTRAVGWMSAAEVERALARNRDFLVASGLDRGVLRGERPKTAIALINPHQKGLTAVFLDAVGRLPLV